MVRGLHWYLVGSVVLGALGVLAGCSGSRFLSEPRAAWRHDAEIACLNSGAVSEGAGKVRIAPINGPGACGADFPIKVSTLGEGAPLAFGDDLRPPSNIPNASMPPRWPAQPSPYETAPGYRPSQARPLDRPVASPYDPRARPTDQEPLYRDRPPDQPLLLDPRVSAQDPYQDPYEVRRPSYGQPPPSRPPVLGRSLGPVRARPVAAGPVSVSPPATLACPIVSALDQWIATAVQPAAVRWFGQPVVEIRQISSYSCRGMNGNPNAHISEHAFGNALDIASFTLADGRKVAVKSGWHGAPEEQGFLHDVQGSACDRFTTVLAPGSNAFHYDHIHVDLMRRANGHRACDPHAVSGEAVAARARARHAGRRGDAAFTGSVSTRRSSRITPDAQDVRLPVAVPGADGLD